MMFGKDCNKIEMPNCEPNNVLKLDANYFSVRPRIKCNVDFQKMTERKILFPGCVDVHEGRFSTLNEISEFNSKYKNTSESKSINMSKLSNIPRIQFIMRHSSLTRENAWQNESELKLDTVGLSNKMIGFEKQSPRKTLFQEKEVTSTVNQD